MERRDFRNLRDALSADEVLRARECVCEELKKILESRDFDTVFTYFPRGRELDVGMFNEYLLEQSGLRVAFPRVEKKSHDIYFYQVESLGEFSKGAFGVMEPVESTKRIYVNPMDAFGKPETSKTLVVTPGVAFDKDKNRMGYGAGYYDKFFLANPGVYKVGCAYECQMAPEGLKAQPHDVRMDALVVV